MNAPDQTPVVLGRRARSQFFIGVGAVKARDERIRDDWTLPLLPLVVILEADGTLADGARHLFERCRA